MGLQDKTTNTTKYNWCWIHVIIAVIIIFHNSYFSITINEEKTVQRPFQTPRKFIAGIFLVGNIPDISPKCREVTYNSSIYTKKSNIGNIWD